MSAVLIVAPGNIKKSREIRRGERKEIGRKWEPSAGNPKVTTQPNDRSLTDIIKK
jgi:hypothetical protein